MPLAAKVLAAETVGDETVLVTDRVGLADVVQQGEVNCRCAHPFMAQGPRKHATLSPPPFKLMDCWETSLMRRG